MFSKELAWQLVTEHVQDPGLRRHMQAVGIGMAYYAPQLGGDPEYWEAVGLVHDFDWEIHPTLPDHPTKGAEILRARGVDEGTIRTVLSHYEPGTGVAPELPIDFALLACDEITGLLIAATLVRPVADIRDLSVSSVKKKWKDKRFAGGVDREHVVESTAVFSHACFNDQLDLWTHIGNVLEAMQQRAEELNLAG
jgi:putative nucleotidyltransferase with HDIG domain